MYIFICKIQFEDTIKKNIADFALKIQIYFFGGEGRIKFKDSMDSVGVSLTESVH